jgi:hypothetical protein
MLSDATKNFKWVCLMLQQFLSSGNLFLEREESVVLYFSEKECVAGLSGEDRPRLIVALPSNVASDEGVLERFLRRLVFSSLLVNLNERKALVCLGLGCSDESFRSLLCRVLVKLRCPGVAFITSCVAALLPLGLSTALVLEFTDALCVAPVTEGGVALGAVQLAQLDDNVGHVFARAVAASPVDLRLELVSHVIVLGTQRERVTLESLREGLPEGLMPHINLVTNPFGRTSLAWLGSSIAGSTLHKKSAGVVVMKGEELKELGALLK